MKLNFKQSYPLVWIVILFSIFLQSCSPQTPPEKTLTQASPTMLVDTAPPGFTAQLKVGLTIPLTGPTAAFGSAVRNGVQLAIDEWNDKGGVLGVEIAPIFEDSQCSSEQALGAANRLIHQKNIHYIIGDVCSGASIAISQAAETEGVIQISPASTEDSVTLNADGSVKKYIFRACYTDSFQGMVIARFALDELKLKDAFILYNPFNSYTVSLANTFEKTFTDGGGTVVGKASYTPNDDSELPVIFDQILKTRAEIVFLGDFYQIANNIIGKAKARGITIPFIGGDGWDSPGLNTAAVDGSYFSTHFSPEDQRLIVKEWVQNYQAHFQSTPDALAVLGYDAMNVLLASIAKAGVDDPDKVAGVMEGIQWEGVSGTFKFNEQHNPVKPAVILQVKDGQMRYMSTVWP